MRLKPYRFWNVVWLVPENFFQGATASGFTVFEGEDDCATLGAIGAGNGHEAAAIGIEMKSSAGVTSAEGRIGFLASAAVRIAEEHCLYEAVKGRLSLLVISQKQDETLR